MMKKVSIDEARLVEGGVNYCPICLEKYGLKYELTVWHTLTFHTMEWVGQHRAKAGK